MIKWPVKTIHRITQKHVEHKDAKDIQSIFVSKSQVDELCIQTAVKENSNVAQYQVLFHSKFITLTI